MGYDLLSTKWTSAELRHWKETYNPILSATALTFCIIAQILYYIFPRLRVFPRSIISWVNVYNMVHMSYVFTKWWPHSSLHEPWVLTLKPGSPICLVGIFLDNADTLGPLCCILLLCLTMFLRIVLRIDIEGKRSYFWGYLAIATVFPIAMALVFTFAYTQTTVGLNCVVNGAGRTILRVIYAILFFGQVILFATTMFYIKRAFMNVGHTTTNNFPMSYLVIRFSAMFICQQYSLLGGQVIQMFQDNPDAKNLTVNAIFTRFVSVSRLTGVLLEALVLILGNVDFMDWVKKLVLRIRTHTSDSTQELTPSREIEMAKMDNPKIVESGEIIEEEELEKTHLSTSAGRMGTSTPKHLSHSEKTATSSEEQQSGSSSEVQEGVNFEHSVVVPSNESENTS